MECVVGMCSDLGGICINCVYRPFLRSIKCMDLGNNDAYVQYKQQIFLIVLYDFGFNKYQLSEALCLLV